ncbi:MAG: cytochrome c oxidase subunit 3 [Alphaproteobacteria bacterium]|nr:MAG: cytochrome c oxidase subunit 3 [Alphaproteobacteria bacterium]
MAHAKQHDFHILNPSIWPFLGAVGGFLMLFGAAWWFHDGPIWVMLIGAAIVAYVMFGWWSDVIEEAHAGYHTPVVRIGLRYGYILFILSEAMFFLAWFWNFVKHALYPMHPEGLSPIVDGTWPPPGIETFNPWELPLINTLILLSSGAAATWAHHAVQHNDRKGLTWGLALAIVLGALFTVFQAIEYSHAGFSFSGNIYGASFFMATGFHGFHVIVGTIFLFVCLLRALKGHFTAEAHVGLEAAVWYWHFVDVVWLFLFSIIYVWGS